ncbi:hypothetical protein BDZ88DRAFT_434194 [Geranomyces variabilis]|nr:hypothetical protein BDZ88DRAFT_434194 [Geranomyces variabilis]
MTTPIVKTMMQGGEAPSPSTNAAEWKKLAPSNAGQAWGRMVEGGELLVTTLESAMQGTGRIFVAVGTLGKPLVGVIVVVALARVLWMVVWGDVAAALQLLVAVWQWAAGAK